MPLLLLSIADGLTYTVGEQAVITMGQFVTNHGVQPMRTRVIFMHTEMLRAI